MEDLSATASEISIGLAGLPQQRSLSLVVGTAEGMRDGFALDLKVSTSGRV